jgi:hypothetical protein
MISGEDNDNDHDADGDDDNGNGNDSSSSSTNRPFMPEPIWQDFADIHQRIQSAHLDKLVKNASPICGQYLKISSHLPKDLRKEI